MALVLSLATDFGSQWQPVWQSETAGVEYANLQFLQSSAKSGPAAVDQCAQRITLSLLNRISISK